MRVGFLGLGARHMAANLLKAGHQACLESLAGAPWYRPLPQLQALRLAVSRSRNQARLAHVARAR